MKYKKLYNNKNNCKFSSHLMPLRYYDRLRTLEFSCNRVNASIVLNISIVFVLSEQQMLSLLLLFFAFTISTILVLLSKNNFACSYTHAKIVYQTMMILFTRRIFSALKNKCNKNINFLNCAYVFDIAIECN